MCLAQRRCFEAEAVFRRSAFRQLSSSHLWAWAASCRSHSVQGTCNPDCICILFFEFCVLYLYSIKTSFQKTAFRQLCCLLLASHKIAQLGTCNLKFHLISATIFLFKEEIPHPKQHKNHDVHDINKLNFVYFYVPELSTFSGCIAFISPPCATL